MAWLPVEHPQPAVCPDGVRHDPAAVGLRKVVHLADRVQVRTRRVECQKRRVLHLRHEAVYGDASAPRVHAGEIDPLAATAGVGTEVDTGHGTSTGYGGAGGTRKGDRARAEARYECSARDQHRLGILSF